ncbi:MAG: XdhC family protein, partial [Ignavibacteriales bacterium]|nr:XdhC family protein [Ignavibacteriales bacterium]
RTYIIIMTPGHKSDEIVLRNTINKNVKYIGMMASPKKRDEIIQKLKKDGFDDKTLNRLHSPIGLPINSHTPAEIAVSIAGELVSVNNKIFV